MAFLIKVAAFLELLQMAALAVFRLCLRARYRGIVTSGDVLIVLSIPLVGLFGQNKNVFYLMLFAMPMLWAANPAALARRYVLVLVLFPELAEVYANGSVYLGVLSALTFFNAGALVALAIARRSGLKPVRSIDVAVWTLFLVTLVFTARGQPVNGALRYVATTLLLVIPPYFIVARTLGSTRAVGDAIGFVVLGGLCNAIVGLFESVRHWALYETFYQTLHVKIMGPLSASLSMRAGLLRADGPVGNYEALGLVTGVSLIAAIAIRRRFTTPGFAVVVLLLAGGLLASQARSAWIATLVGLGIQAGYDRRWRRLAAIAGIAGIAGALALAASSGGMVGQLLGKGGDAADTGQYRQNLLGRGLEEAERHPLTGQTLDQLQVSMNDLRQGDHIIDFVNTHLLVMLTGGFGAELLWLLAWAVPLVQGWRLRRRIADGGQDADVAGLASAVVGMIFLFLTFTSPIDRILPLAAIGMGLMSAGIGLSSVAGGRDRARRRPGYTGARLVEPARQHGLARAVTAPDQVSDPAVRP